MSVSELAGEQAGRPLAEALWPRHWLGDTPAGNAIRFAVLALVGTGILALSAKISVLTVPVPITLQTLAIMALSAAYGRRLAVATVVLYLAEGLVGIPVFAYGAGAGPAYLAGTTGGFLIGFVALAYIVGWAADRGWDRSVVKLFLAMVAAEAIVFVLGFAWLAWGALLSGEVWGGIGAELAWSLGIQPFILADVVKIALASFGVAAGWELVERWRRR
jgi:biotin transport system substrate-specific component